MPVGAFHSPGDDVDARNGRSRLSECGQRLLGLHTSSTLRSGVWRSLGYQACSDSQVIGGTADVGHQAASAGQAVAGHRGHCTDEDPP